MRVGPINLEIRFGLPHRDEFDAPAVHALLDRARGQGGHGR